MIWRALNLAENKLKPIGRMDISRLQLFISKGGARKLHFLDSLLTSLKKSDNLSKDNYLVMVSIGKATLAVNSSTLHCTKYRLSFTAQKTSKSYRESY